MATIQRFTQNFPCPVCGGYDTLARGQGVRCYGFISGAGDWGHCTREEHAGTLQMSSSSGGFPHRLTGNCRCGVTHAGHSGPPIQKTARFRQTTSVDQALDIWDKSVSIEGTLAEAYLRFRGITIGIPSSLRFAKNLRYSAAQNFPAMVAGIRMWPEKQVVAVHRTFLNQDGSEKAPVRNPKKLFGRVKRGAVRLAPATETLVIGEGIETCLSVMEATGLPAWAALSSSFLPAVLLPEMPLASTVIIAADNDGAGMSAAGRAMGIWREDGRKVFVAKPPGSINDFNDLLRGAI